VKELSFLLLDTRLFNLVERRTLDPIMTERRFRLTGAVDDTSALSIGHHTGAEIVMTGAISANESEKYLSLRALDVESKKVLAITSERFID
jgi:curli biogenesis system outer membrane secretion channel CsgG